MKRPTNGLFGIMGLLCVLYLAGPPTLVIAEESIVDLNSLDVMKSAREQHLGKRVKVKLESGQDIKGKVAKVGSHALHLTELAGMEFFEATVKLADITAVIVKARAK